MGLIALLVMSKCQWWFQFQLWQVENQTWYWNYNHHTTHTIQQYQSKVNIAEHLFFTLTLGTKQITVQYKYHKNTNTII